MDRWQIVFHRASPLFDNAYFIATGRVMPMVEACCIYMKIWAGFPKVPKENQPLEILAYTGTDRIGFVPSPLMGSIRLFASRMWKGSCAHSRFYR